MEKLNIDGLLQKNKPKLAISKGAILGIALFEIKFKGELKKQKGLYRICIKNGEKVFEALWRPKILEKYCSAKIKHKTKYKREVAFYLVAGFLGIDNVPPVVIRKIKGYSGSLQVRIIKAAQKRPKNLFNYLKSYNPRIINKLAFLDFVCGNLDRNPHNLLVSGKKLWLIDNGLSFFIGPPPKRFFQSKYQVIRQFYNPKYRNEILRLVKLFRQDKKIKSLRKKLMPLLKKSEIRAIFQRVDCLTKDKLKYN